MNLALPLLVVGHERGGSALVDAEGRVLVTTRHADPSFGDAGERAVLEEIARRVNLTPTIVQLLNALGVLDQWLGGFERAADELADDDDPAQNRLAAALRVTAAIARELRAGYGMRSIS